METKITPPRGRRKRLRIASLENSPVDVSGAKNKTSMEHQQPEAMNGSVRKEKKENSPDMEKETTDGGKVAAPTTVDT